MDPWCQGCMRSDVELGSEGYCADCADTCPTGKLIYQTADFAHDALHMYPRGCVPVACGECGLWHVLSLLCECGKSARWRILSDVTVKVSEPKSRHEGFACDRHLARVMREISSDGLRLVWPASAKLPTEVHFTFA